MGCLTIALLVYHLCRDGKLFEYQGERTAASIRDWGLSLLTNHVKKVSSQVWHDRGEGLHSNQLVAKGSLAWS